MKETSHIHYHLQRLLPAQWEAYKSIRLEALQTNPEVFSSNYAREAAYQPSDWKGFLEKDSRAMFGLYEGQELIGLTGITLDRDDATRAVLFASFIRPGHRGKGLSELFYKARIDWARAQKCNAIVVSHRAGNEASKAANQRFGFIYSHTEPMVWPDGERADEVVYILELTD